MSRRSDGFRDGAGSLGNSPQQAPSLKAGERLVEPVCVRRGRAGLTKRDENLLLRGRELAARGFQFECIDLTALDPDRVGYAGDGAGGLQDRGLNRATKAAIRHGKHEDTRRAALVVMLHDCTLNGILGAVPALTGGHSASPSGPRARARSTSRAGLARGRLLSQV